MPNDCTDYESAVAHVLRGLPDCFSLIVEFQDGVHGDLRDRFQEIYKPLTTGPLHFGLAVWPIDCRPLQCMSEERIIRMADLSVYLDARDRRLPLHLAIAEGEHEVVRRIWRMDPSLVTQEAFRCAIVFNQVEMLEWFFPFVNEEDESDEFYTGVKYPFGSLGDFRRRSVRKPTWEKLFQLGFPIADSKYLGKSPVMHYLRISDDSALEYFFDIVGDNFRVHSLLLLLAIAVERNLGQLVERALHQITCKQDELNDISWREFSYVIKALSSCGVLEWIKAVFNLTNGQHWRMIFSEAARRNHIHVLEWLMDNRTQEIPSDEWFSFVQSSSFETIEWFATNYASCLAQPWLSNGIYVSDVRIVELLRLFGQPLHTVWPGSLDVARFLVGQNITLGKPHLQQLLEHHSVHAGRENCSLDLYNLVVYIIETFPSLVIDQDILNSAALCGPLSVLRYLYEHSTENCNNNVFDEVLINGDLAKVKYLREEKGLQWSSQGLRRAIESKSIELVKYVIAADQDGVLRMSESIWFTRFSLEVMQCIATVLPSCTKLWLPGLVRCGDFKTIRKVLTEDIETSDIAESLMFFAITLAIKHGEIRMIEFLWCELKAIVHDDSIINRYSRSFAEEFEDGKKTHPHSGPWEKLIVLFS